MQRVIEHQADPVTGGDAPVPKVSGQPVRPLVQLEVGQLHGSVVDGEVTRLDPAQEIALLLEDVLQPIARAPAGALVRRGEDGSRTQLRVRRRSGGSCRARERHE
ncbi:hypothetical protein GCM10022399_11080 [Terrabacter ginsenosidimutans]|uniref:Uncharacterized protein n=1 Tax=Terrabacter ginsenosidimutans TaxID=490575 RepID=A0ABP7CUA2_9MICO